MTSIIRCVIFALMFMAYWSYAQEKTIDVSEHVVYKGPVTTADNFCETILYNPTLGIATIKMHDFITEDPDVVVNVDGVKVTDLVDDTSKPGNATAGKHIRVPNGDERTIQPNVGFTVVLLSKQLTTALDANKTVAITISPQNMFDKSPKTINFPAEPNCSK